MSKRFLQKLGGVVDAVVLDAVAELDGQMLLNSQDLEAIKAREGFLQTVISWSKCLTNKRML